MSRAKPAGSIHLNTKFPPINDCWLRIESSDDNQTVQIRFLVSIGQHLILSLTVLYTSLPNSNHNYLKEIHFTSCSDGEVAIDDRVDDPAMRYQIFSSYPHFCGSESVAKDKAEIAAW